MTTSSKKRRVNDKRSTSTSNRPSNQGSSQSKRPPAISPAIETKVKKDYAEYAKLRTILDALEIGAIRRYLKGDNAAERSERFEEIESQLKPIIRYWSQLADPEMAKVKGGSLKDKRRKTPQNAAAGGDSAKAAAISPELEGGCPDGFINCNGVCVPYTCP
jgi:hypothetical protein